MLKSLICFLGLCSFVYAASIDVIEVPQGRLMENTPTCIVIDSCDKLGFMKTLASPHLFIELDGTVRCFVPNDAQITANLLDKLSPNFPEEKREKVMKTRDDFTKLSEKNYENLADYLMGSHYGTEFSYSGFCGWGGRRNCDNFSINIVLERERLSQEELLRSDGYIEKDLYSDRQIDVVYNVFKALTDRGIKKTNIVGRRDVSISFSAPYSSFWRQFYKKYNGFFFLPNFNTAHKINDARELRNALLKIGYTKPDYLEDWEWVYSSTLAFVMRYFPFTHYNLVSDNEQELWSKLIIRPYILSAIEQIANI